ncbi:MAG: type II secretion system F family protein [Armatimonadetes bacterium]|nr:type II secretion system F family protein [Armatimonadota bacterium]
MIYSYEAKDGGGRTVTGSLDAQDEGTAARQVRDMGYFLMRLAPSAVPQGANGAVWPPPPSAPTREPSAPAWTPSAPAMPWWRWLLARLVYPVWSGVGLRDLALFYRQFATMIHAGVPIYQCLTTLTVQTANPTLRRCIGAIGRRVQAGGAISAAMGEYPWLFLDFHRAMVAAGEMTGRLDLMFARLADALEQEYLLRGIIKRETFYPCLVLLASFLLQPQAMVVLVAQGSGRGYLRLVAPSLLGSLGALLLVYVLVRLLSQFKAVFDAVASHLPAVGGAVRLIALARFARALSLLYAAGLAIPNALRTAAAACGNAYLARKMVRAIPALETGQGIAQSLERTGAFPPMVVTMLGVGEQSGDLDQTMTKVAEYFEQEAAVRLHQLCVSLGVIVTILVGVRVGLGVIHYYTGYFNNLLNTDTN